MDNSKVIIEQALVLAEESLHYLNKTWTYLKKASRWLIGTGNNVSDAIEMFEHAKHYMVELGKKLKSTKLGFDDFEEFADYYMSYCFDADMERGELIEARDDVEDLIDKIRDIKEQLIIAFKK